MSYLSELTGIPKEIYVIAKELDIPADHLLLTPNGVVTVKYPVLRLNEDLVYRPEELTELLPHRKPLKRALKAGDILNFWKNSVKSGIPFTELSSADCYDRAVRDRFYSFVKDASKLSRVIQTTENALSWWLPDGLDLSTGFCYCDQRCVDGLNFSTTTWIPDPEYYGYEIVTAHIRGSEKNLLLTSKKDN
jgi:hypothetical protein